MSPFSPIHPSAPIVTLLSFFLVNSSTKAQPSRDNQDSEIVLIPSGDSLLRWYGHSDRSYFIQVSDASDPLGKWNWAPIIEAGNDEEISHEIGGLAGKAFFRLKYTSLIPGPGETLDTADFDQDGLSNIDEIVPPPPFLASAATDPLDRDTDNDGLPDGFERGHGLDPNDPGTGNPNNGPIGDPDSDGLTNAEELAKGTNPQNEDSDNDLVNDGEDADPKEFGIDWKLTPEPRFAVIDLPVGNTEGIFFDDLSDNGTVLLSRVVEGDTVERILMDVNLNSHSFLHHFPHLNPPIGAFRSVASALVGSNILGTRIVAGPVEEECLWNPVENTYTPFLIPAHQDDIFDDRGIFRVDRTSVPPPATLKTPYGPLQGSVEDSRIPRLEENGNIVAANGYWRFDAINNTYGNITLLPEDAQGSSATLKQTWPDPIGPPIQNTWNLIAGVSNLLVSRNNAAFIQTNITTGIIGATQQGWLVGSHQIWSNGSWNPIRDLVSGPKPIQVELLGMLDTGFGIARFETSGAPPKIVLLVPMEFEIKHLENERDADGNETQTIVNPGPNSMLRDEIVDIRIKVPPIGTTGWTVVLTIDPEAMRTQNLPGRGDVMMYDFGEVDNQGTPSSEDDTVTPDKTQFELQASAGGELTIRAVFNKEGKLKIKMNSTDGKISLTSPEYTVKERIRKYAVPYPGFPNQDPNKYDQQFVDGALYWGNLYRHPIDTVDRLKAISVAESNVGAHVQNNVLRPHDILTIGHPDDDVLETIQGNPEQWDLDLVHPKKPAADHRYKNLSFPEANIGSTREAIKWGILWLYVKAFAQAPPSGSGIASTIKKNPDHTWEKRNQAPLTIINGIEEPEYQFVDWHTWENATKFYNGGGDSANPTKIEHAFKKGQHYYNGTTKPLWPIRSDKSGRP